MTYLTETYQLHNGVSIPKIGFGTWQIANGDDAYSSVTYALNAGYIHIDTAVAYGNEASVGQAVRDSGLERASLFITSKVPAEIKSYEDAKAKIQQSLDALDLEYTDLMLIHAPRPWDEMGADDAPRYVEENAAVWRALEEFYEAGKLKAIGVSNFDIDDLTALAKTAKVQPMVNQIRLFIGHMTPELVDYCQTNDIIVEAYSPFATGRLLDDESLTSMAEQKGVTVPQLSLRYLLEKQLLPLPKSTHKEYIEANTQLDFDLTPEEVAQLDSIEEDR